LVKKWILPTRSKTAEIDKKTEGILGVKCLNFFKKPGIQHNKHRPSIWHKNPDNFKSPWKTMKSNLCSVCLPNNLKLMTRLFQKQTKKKKKKNL
jgi:hypothetical protein